MIRSSKSLAFLATVSIAMVAPDAAAFQQPLASSTFQRRPVTILHAKQKKLLDTLTPFSTSTTTSDAEDAAAKAIQEQLQPPAEKEISFSCQQIGNFRNSYRRYRLAEKFALLSLWSYLLGWISIFVPSSNFQAPFF